MLVLYIPNLLAKTVESLGSFTVVLKPPSKDKPDLIIPEVVTLFPLVYSDALNMAITVLLPLKICSEVKAFFKLHAAFHCIFTSCILVEIGYNKCGLINCSIALYAVLHSASVTCKVY